MRGTRERELFTSITGCVRCGENHRRVKVKLLEVPIEDEGVSYTHGCMCPTKPDAKPILMRILRVQEGQVWEDADPRSAGRLVKVIEVGETMVRVEVVRDRRGAILSSIGRQSEVRISAFTGTQSRGFRLYGGTDHV